MKYKYKEFYKAEVFDENASADDMDLHAIPIEEWN